MFKSYIERFNSDDIEYYKQDIDNEHAYEWLKENIPVIDIPDKDLEKIYYFRWWVYRKHIKSTESGYVITEFLPYVPWSGKYNTIIAASGHHISEGKWLKNGGKILKQYLKFWLDEKGNTYTYSSWLCYSIYELCNHLNDYDFAVENLELMIKFFNKTVEQHKTDSGLFWSIDDNDAMEYSISGVSENMQIKKGIRPTLNSYMAANAYAIAEIAKKAERFDLAEEYTKKYEEIKNKLHILWDCNFYKAIHVDDFINDEFEFSNVNSSQNVKELIGYIPWCFNLPPEGNEKAFEELKNECGFKSKYGLTTAEQRHWRFLYDVNHPCLWNGYIWPFATTQVLNAVINLLDNYSQETITTKDFYDILKAYERCHYLKKEDGQNICWIDEVINPNNGKWSSREFLQNKGWKKEEGGKERGKDYNHSAFCDIILHGLLGITLKNGEIYVNPHIPDEWEYFSVENLWYDKKNYKIIYDKTGKHYNIKQGIVIQLISDR